MIAGSKVRSSQSPLVRSSQWFVRLSRWHNARPYLGRGKSAGQALMTRIFYSSDYVSAAHGFDTTRKARWVAQGLRESPLPGLDLVEPNAATEDQIASVHDRRYVKAVRTGKPRPLAESQGFQWDPELWKMVLASNGGAVAAARAALDDGVAGSLSSGLHHARYDRGAGFCTFNGLVLAARDAIARGAQSVLILDLDAHCGGGTASLIADDDHITQVDVSVDGFDYYPTTQRARLYMVRDALGYLPTVERALDDAYSSTKHYDLCIYNAGMDPYEKSRIGGLRGITKHLLAQRERLVFDFFRKRGTPLAFVLAGGYVSTELDEARLVGLHRLTLREASTMDKSLAGAARRMYMKFADSLFNPKT
jgi:acetoin utilization deacetylase AcuC-like enzyme